MKYLVVKRGADMLAEDVGGFTPLLNAVWRDDPHVVRFFLGRPECTLAHLMVGGRERERVGLGAWQAGCGWLVGGGLVNVMDGWMDG